MAVISPKEQSHKGGVGPLFIFSCMFATILVTSIVVYRSTSRFRTTDVLAPIQYLTPNKVKELGGMPTEVGVGLCINSFRTFDINKNDFVFDGILWFEFDPSHISLSTIEQFSFDRGEILYRSAPISMLRDGKLFVRYDIRLRFSSTMNYERFPVDDHRLTIMLINRSTSPGEVIFKSRNANFVVVPDMKVVGWHEFKHDVETGYIVTRYNEVDKLNKLEYPVAAFTIDYGRQSNVRNVIIIVLPMLLLFFISLFSLIIDPEKWFATAISIPIQGIVGLIAYRFVMETMSPTVGYFMYSDFFFFLFLSLMFCILLLHTMGLFLGIRSRRIIIILLSLMIMVSFIYVLLR